MDQLALRISFNLQRREQIRSHKNGSISHFADATAINDIEIAPTVHRYTTQ
jgi:hypothetical protein